LDQVLPPQSFITTQHPLLVLILHCTLPCPFFLSQLVLPLQRPVPPPPPQQQQTVFSSVCLLHQKQQSEWASCWFSSSSSAAAATAKGKWWYDAI
jgi:hypothetical protein